MNITRQVAWGLFLAVLPYSPTQFMALLVDLFSGNMSMYSNNESHFPQLLHPSSSHQFFINHLDTASVA